ncbi:MAG: transporter [Chlorobiaceae bacterium]|nr:transporter [Chlorobiaceae bacterium]
MRKKVLFTIAAMIWATPIYASHPLITDDTNSQGKGRFQLELNTEFSRDRESASGISEVAHGTTASAMLSYGLSDRIDLIAGVPTQWSRLEENGSVTADNSGMGDLTLEIKYRLLENRDKGVSLAIKPGVSIPSGDESKGFGNGKVSGGVMVIATRESKLCSYHVNFGYTRNEYRLADVQNSMRNDIWHASLAAMVNVSSALRAVTDIGIETNSSRTSDIAPAFIIGGLIYGVSDNMDLDLGIKGGLNRAETDTTLLAGIALRF